MDLFCFASRNLENIRRGFAARRWAVATVSDAAMKGRITRARKYFRPGVCGLLFCGETHSFTLPFKATLSADPTAVVSDVWPEPWVLPFSIEPLGSPEKQLHMDKAKARWPILVERAVGPGGVTAAMNATGATAFAPAKISDADWGLILRDLS